MFALIEGPDPHQAENGFCGATQAGEMKTRSQTQPEVTERAPGLMETSKGPRVPPASSQALSSLDQKRFPMASNASGQGVWPERRLGSTQSDLRGRRQAGAVVHLLLPDVPGQVGRPCPHGRLARSGLL